LPRSVNILTMRATLIGFQHPSCYGDILIRPSRKVFDELIIQEWSNIQRIMASLAHKDVTQAHYRAQTQQLRAAEPNKKALWELDNLCRTLYILDFIDDPKLRQSVQKALNRGEAYHRLRRAVAYVNGGKFRVKTEDEQQIWNECSRLITNAMIYYNTALLSRVYEQKRAAGDRAAMAAMAGISPIHVLPSHRRRNGRGPRSRWSNWFSFWCDRVQPRPMPGGPRCAGGPLRGPGLLGASFGIF
jgi:hypothetical protein